MCSHRRDLAHITPHIYGEGCGHRLMGVGGTRGDSGGGGRRSRTEGREQQVEIREDQPWLMNFIPFLLK